MSPSRFLAISFVEVRKSLALAILYSFMLKRIELSLSYTLYFLFISSRFYFFELRRRKHIRA
jgi:hypothetical protein